MRVKVNKDKCMSCGSCPSLVPDVFEFDDNGVAGVIQDPVKKELEEDVKQAIEFCPTGAISTLEEDSEA